MDLQEVKSYYDIAIVTSSSILTTFLLKHLEERVKDKKLATLFVVMAVSMITLFANLFLVKLIDTSATIRKLIDPDNYIEGYFYDVTMDSNNVANHGFLLQIMYDKGSYLTSGDAFDSSGNHIATSNSTASNYSNRVLYFEYHTTNTYSAGYKDWGIDQLSFEKPTNSYTGFWMDYNSSSREHSISGTRISEEEINANHNFLTTENKCKFMAKKIKEYNNCHCKKPQ